MHCSSGLSQLSDSRLAVEEALARLQQNWPPGTAANLVLVFASQDHAGHFAAIAKNIRGVLQPGLMLGCTGEAIAENRYEVETGPAIAIWAAFLPGAEVVPFRVSFERTPDGIVSEGLPELPDELAREARVAILLAEPFSSDPDSIIAHFANEFPRIPLVGGMASGGGPGDNRLMFHDEVVEEGAIGAVLVGGPTVTAIVSQGCRPIGPTYVVTKAERNVIGELGGKSALLRLQEIYPTLSPHDQKLIEQGLFLGIAMDEYKESFGRGDFLVANVIGADRNTGNVAIGHKIRIGQTIQFHLRDAAAADEDLVDLLDRYAATTNAVPSGALLFSCNGRGTRMFPEPHHDASRILERLGQFPLAGFFAQGEFGPIGGKNFLHGFTASIALFSSSTSSAETPDSLSVQKQGNSTATGEPDATEA